MAIDENAPLELMISSRSTTKVRRNGKGTTETMTDLRRRAKTKLESLFAVGDEHLFDVWIHEDDTHQTLDANWYQASERRARRADVVIVLFTGESGSKLVGDMGVCHAEFVAALDDTDTKVSVIDLRDAVSGPVDVDPDFVAEVDRPGRWQDTAASGDEAVERVCAHALAVVRTLSHHGTLDVRRRSRTGSEIEWERLPFEDRKRRMEETLDEALRDVLPDAGDAEASVDGIGRVLVGRIADRRILFVCHAAPAGLALAASREMVGQPFLRDHRYANAVDTRKTGTAGPVHVIATFGSATEAQARRLLGFPDATIVKDTWGIWVSDAIQRVQLLLVDRCTSVSTTRARVQQAAAWLAQSREDRTLVERAAQRAKIVKTMAE